MTVGTIERLTPELWTPEKRVVRSPNGDVRINLPPPGRLHLPSGRLMPISGGAAADAWQFTNFSRLDILDGTTVLDTDTFKMALFDVASNLADTIETFAALTNEEGDAGYTAGGEALTTLTLTGTVSIICDTVTNPVWTATTGITTRYAVIYEVGVNILCWTTLDGAPADVVVTAGNTLTVTINTGGIFTVSGA